MHLHNIKVQKIYESIQMIDSQKICFVICVAGYESRSTFLFEKIKNLRKEDKNIKYCVLGFCNRKNAGTRSHNNDIYAKSALRIKDFSPSDTQEVKNYVLQEIDNIRKNNQFLPLDIYLDYSSMPRLWYCELFKALNSNLLSEDTLYMWYSEGKYSEDKFPTASMDGDISILSGSSTPAPPNRTHLLGLGFDRTRSSAIFRVLDPQHLVCFYGGKREYIERAKSDNKDLIDASDFCFETPIDDFPVAFSKIVDVTRELSDIGDDVILVPDGPKPLVLASFLVPDYLDKRGIVVFHVKKHSSLKLEIIDVPASGEVYGFSVSGSPSSEKCNQ